MINNAKIDIWYGWRWTTYEWRWTRYEWTKYKKNTKNEITFNTNIWKHYHHDIEWIIIILHNKETIISTLRRDRAIQKQILGIGLSLPPRNGLY